MTFFKKLFLFLFLLPILAFANTELHWDWKSIDTNEIYFKPNFIWGVAISEYQYSGKDYCPHSNFAAWEEGRSLSKNPPLPKERQSGTATNFFITYKEDIERIKKLGLKGLRFSLEWSLIEPEQGRIDYAALNRYKDMCNLLNKAGIQPVVTLHHFTHPEWFERLGGFENVENIHYFVSFCELMMRELGNKVALWTTFNEPGVYMYNCYVRGVWPPCKKGLNRAGQVLANMLQAHVYAYQAMKKIAPKAQVGLVHAISQFEPYTTSLSTNILKSSLVLGGIGGIVAKLPGMLVGALIGSAAAATAYALEGTVVYYLNHTFHDAITEFLATGVFRFYVPGMAYAYYKNDARALDFIGLNYYSHVMINVPPTFINAGATYREGEIKMDKKLYTIYPEGFYRAIMEVSQRLAKPLNIPIYITENGIPDAKDDRRALFIKQYIYALYKAMQDGCDVRGYFYWTFYDCWSWSGGYGNKWGLYHVDMKTKKRTMREGAKVYFDIVKKTYE